MKPLIPTSATLPVAFSAKRLSTWPWSALVAVGVINASPNVTLLIARPIAPPLPGRSPTVPSAFVCQYGPPTPKKAFTFVAPIWSELTGPWMLPGPSSVISWSATFSKANEPVMYANWSSDSVTEPKARSVVFVYARSIAGVVGPVGTVSLPPGRRVKSTALPVLALLTSTPSEPVSSKPLTPSSVATPLARNAVYVRGVPLVTTSVSSARPTLTWLSEMPTSPVAAGDDGAPTIRPPRPAKTLASPRPIFSTETRTVVEEPVGVTSSSSPFSKEKLPAA